MSATVFHVKHSKESRTPEASILPDRQRQQWGPRPPGARPPPPLRSKDQSRLFLVKRCSRRQRIDQAGEVLITRELNGDTPLLRSTCHLHASVEGIGQPG